MPQEENYREYKVHKTRRQGSLSAKPYCILELAGELLEISKHKSCLRIKLEDLRSGNQISVCFLSQDIVKEFSLQQNLRTTAVVLILLLLY